MELREAYREVWGGGGVSARGTDVAPIATIYELAQSTIVGNLHLLVHLALLPTP